MQNNSTKHVELIEIINQTLFLHLVSCPYLFISMMHGPANIKCVEVGNYLRIIASQKDYAPWRQIFVERQANACY